MRQVDRVIVLSALIGLGLVLALSPDTPVRPQDRGPGDHGFQHHLHHDWYKDVKQPSNGYSCCNALTPDGAGDCRPTEARQDAQGRWTAVIDGVWTLIPDEVVVDAQFNKEWGMAHVCAHGPRIYCFLPKRTGG